MKMYAIQFAVIAVWVAVSSGLVGCAGGGDSTAPATSSSTGTPTEVSTMTGTWNGAFDDGAAIFALSLTQTDTMLSGTFVRTDGSGSGPATGEIVSNALDLTTVREPGHTVLQWQWAVGKEEKIGGSQQLGVGRREREVLRFEC